MGSTQGAFIQFVDQLSRLIPGFINLMEINPLVSQLNLPDHKLTVLYYMPGSVRVYPQGDSVSENTIVHLDEDVWLNKNQLVLGRIQSMAGQAQRLHARQTVVARIDKKTTVAFLEEHHLNTPLAGKYRYGLFTHGELIAVCVFSGGRTMRHTEGHRSFEAIRFCTKQGYVVVGGLSKLFMAFYRDFHPNDIMTYVDLDWGNGEKYEKMGFQKVSYLEPQYYWVDRQSHHRTLCKPASTRTEPIGKNTEDRYLVANSGSLKMIKAYID